MSVAQYSPINNINKIELGCTEEPRGYLQFIKIQVINYSQCRLYSESLRAGWSGVRIPVRYILLSVLQAGTAAYYTMGNESFLGSKRGLDVTLTTHPYLEPMLKKEYNLPLLLLCGFVAGYRMKYTLW